MTHAAVAAQDGLLPRWSRKTGLPEIVIVFAVMVAVLILFFAGMAQVNAVRRSNAYHQCLKHNRDVTVDDLTVNADQSQIDDAQRTLVAFNALCKRP